MLRGCHVAARRASVPWRCGPRQLGASRLLSSKGPSTEPEKPAEKPSRWQQLKATFREHGPVFVAWYGVTWGAGFGVCWTGVTLSGLDGVELLRWLGAEQVIDLNAFSPRVVNALIAAEINELAEPIRLPLVLTSTPALSRALRARGWRSGKPAAPPAPDASAKQATPAARPASERVKR